MQIKTGKATATNGSSLVYGNSSADWSQVTIGSLFLVVGRVYYYTVSAVSYNSGSSRWEITLDRNYQQATVSAVDYIIVRDFTFYYGLPLLSTGDVETAAIFSRAMAKLDEQLKRVDLVAAEGGGGGGGGGTTYTKAGHNFVIGSVLRTDSSGVIQLAASDTEENSRVIGIVDSVTGDDFTIKAGGGLITAIPITLTPGTVYYLKNAATPNNLTSNVVTETTIKLPLLVAVTSSSGIFFGAVPSSTQAMVGATSGAPGISGAVPTPAAGDENKLLTGGGLWWAVLNGISFKHLKSSPAFTTGDWSAIDPEDSIYNALVNLHTRLAAKETTDYSYFNAYQDNGIFRWLCPDGVTSVKITAIGAGGKGGIWSGGGSAKLAGSGGGGGEYIEAIVSVSPGTLYHVNVGRGGSGVTGPSGSLAVANGGGDTIFRTDSVTLLTAKGGGGGKGTGNSPETNAGLGGTGGEVTGTVLRRIAGGNGGFASTSSGITNVPGNGGSCFRGGAGGYHLPPQYVGEDGHFPGGGGSGGIVSSTGFGGSNLVSGNGANGYLKIEWN